MAGEQRHEHRLGFSESRTRLRERTRFASRDVYVPSANREEDEFFKGALDVHLPPELIAQPASATVINPPKQEKPPLWKRALVAARKAAGWTLIGAGYAINLLFWVPFAVYPGGPVAFAMANPVLAGALLIPALGTGLIAAGYCLRDGHINFFKAFKAAATDVGKVAGSILRFGKGIWRRARGIKPESTAEPAPSGA